MDDEDLFHLALETPADERPAFLDRACSGDVVRRGRVEVLLRSHETPDSFLVGPAVNPDETAELDPDLTMMMGPGRLAEELPNRSPSAEGPGSHIGPYKLLQEIGEGGMGTVFMAEQVQPVRRRVALKVIKPGMDSRQVIARFEVERQALALMDHVNIARVLDAGSTESGRPYFVMELVHGVPITQYCDDHHLTPRQRLELFVPVCQAIQHAHQKGIIHRDIKPSNVLVTMYDGKPVAKVIDFGVAKATEQRLTERTLFTQYGTLVGTLEYMSPEQAEMSALGVDTRSDIYSLGVLVYELLTGGTPLGRERVRAAAYGEVLRRIKEEEPSRPSTRLSESGEALASISAMRHTEPSRLARLVRGELDWIVMKSLEKDRSRRYETASAFAADVQRYLGDEPVQACPPSARYRLGKFVRRNRAAVIASMLVSFTLLAVVVGTTLGLVIHGVLIVREQRETERQRVLAERRANLLERELYSNRVNLAYRECLENNIGLAERLLDECPTARRGWEWDYIKRLCHFESLTVRPNSLNGPQSVFTYSLAISPFTYSLAISPDGERIASVGGSSVVIVLEMATGRTLHALRGQGPLFSVAFSIDGKRVAAGGPGRVTLWEVESGNVIRTLEGHNDIVSSLAFSPDGKRIASSTSTSITAMHRPEVKIWEVEDGRELGTFDGERHWGTQRLAFDPDGQRLAVVHDWRGVIELLDGTTANLIRSLDSATGNGGFEVAYRPGGRQIASACRDGTLSLVDAETGSIVRNFWGHKGAATGVAFSPDGRQLASSSIDGAVRLWATETGREVAIFRGHKGPVQGVRFSPDGKRLVSFGDDQAIKIWEISAAGDQMTLEGNQGWAFRVQFTPDGRLVTGGFGIISIRDPVTGHTFREIRAPGGGVQGLALSPDGRRVGAAREFRDTFDLFDTTDGHHLITFRGHTGRVRGLAFAPDGRQLASASDDATIRLWDAETGLEVRAIRGHVGGIFAVAFSPDGRRLASIGWDGTARLWELKTGIELQVVRGVARTPSVNFGNAVAFSPDSRRVASAADGGRVVLWDVETGNQTLTLGGISNGVLAVTFDPEGRRVASAFEDGTIKIWDAETGDELLTLRGHVAGVLGVAFSPDGQRIASASQDMTVKVWDAAPPSWDELRRRGDTTLAEARKDSEQDGQTIRGEYKP